MLSLLLAASLASAPLEVRVLERHHPHAVHLEAPRVRCGEAALPGAVDAQPGAHALEVAGRECPFVLAEGGVTVRVGQLTRHYRGAVRATLEGAAVRLVNEVDVEDYLPSVVAAEADGGGPAALEAQAIVSRTFALASRQRHAREGYGLCDLAHCQVYRGVEGETPASRAAVARTRGQVLLVGGVKLEPAFFHAACGGHTSSAQDVFGAAGAGVGVSDVVDGQPACRGAPDFAWSFEVDRVALAHGLELKPEGAAFEPLRRDAAGRVLELKSFGRRFTGPAFQSKVGRAFGWGSLKSLKLTAQEVDHTVRFSGTGVGHGVGLCQHGARALAAKGQSATEILQRYFPDCQVRVYAP